MKIKLHIQYIVFLTVFCSISIQGQGSNHNIFVDGAFSPGEKDGPMDKLLDERLAEASNQIKRIRPGDNRKTVDSKQALLAALSKIKCKCGDNINLYLAGHGGKEKFIFSKSVAQARKKKARLSSKELKANKVLTADELKAALGVACIEDCCKVNVVIFACHSGSFIDALLEDPHVRSVYTSSRANQKSYSNAYFQNKKDFHDGGDWLKGFNEDLKAVPKGSTSAEAIAKATESAKEKMPITMWQDQTPEAKVRDNLNVVAHVKGTVKKNKVKVTIYEPEHLRGQTKEIELGNNEHPPNLKACMWIQGPADFRYELVKKKSTELITFTGPVTLSSAPKENVLGHIIGTKGRKKVVVQLLKPSWLFHKKNNRKKNKVKTSTVNSDAVINDKEVKNCNWIEQNVTVLNPYSDYTTDKIRLANPTLRIKLHFESPINHETGLMKGKILSPKWLTKYYKDKIVIDPKYFKDRVNFKKCNNFWMDLTIPINGNPTGTNIRRMLKKDVKTYSSDVAINPLEKPTHLPISGTMIPKVVSTNIGEDTSDYTVRILIDESAIVDLTEEEMDRIVDSVGEIPGLNKTEVDDQSELLDYNTVYEDSMEMEDVPPAESRESSFRPFVPVPGRLYRIRAIIEFNGDQVPANNNTSLIFYVKKREVDSIPESFVITAVGTGNTTGHVVDMTVTNTGDSAQSTRVGYFIIPSEGKYQSYLIHEDYLISLDPGETQTIPLYGYCLRINLPALPKGHKTVSFTLWITPDKVGAIPTPENPPSSESGYVTVDESEFTEFYPLIPGTDIVSLNKIDLDKNLIGAAPSLYFAAEYGSTVISESVGDGSFPSVISGDPFKLTEDLNQNFLWNYTGTIDTDTLSRHSPEKLRENMTKQIAEKKGVDPDLLTPEINKALELLAAEIYTSLELVGDAAKILKRKNPQDTNILQEEDPDNPQGNIPDNFINNNEQKNIAPNVKIENNELIVEGTKADDSITIKERRKGGPGEHEYSITITSKRDNVVFTRSLKMIGQINSIKINGNGGKDNFEIPELLRDAITLEINEEQVTYYDKIDPDKLFVKTQSKGNEHLSIKQGDSCHCDNISSTAAIVLKNGIEYIKDKIKYNKDTKEYEVKLFNTHTEEEVEVKIEFDHKVHQGDAQPEIDKNGEPINFWPLLIQRAFMQLYHNGYKCGGSKSETGENAWGIANALKSLTGENSETELIGNDLNFGKPHTKIPDDKNKPKERNKTESQLNDLESCLNYLLRLQNDKKIMIASTNNCGFDCDETHKKERIDSKDEILKGIHVSTVDLSANHCYVIKSVQKNEKNPEKSTVTLYNPHGNELTISISDFWKSFASIRSCPSVYTPKKNK